MDKFQPNIHKYNCYIRQNLEMSFDYAVLQNQGAPPSQDYYQQEFNNVWKTCTYNKW